MAVPTLMVLGTGGTIAGLAGSATRADYRPGQIGLADFIGRVEALGLPARLFGKQVANIGSEDIGPEIWRRLHAECVAALADDGIAGVIVTHGTDTAEETALLLDLTLPTTKPVVLVGAMRPADVVGSDGLRNFANAVRLASDPAASRRGVMLVMGDRAIAARDARKARTRGTDAFRGFPRDGVAAVTPSALEWFGPAWREDTGARFAFPERFPKVPIVYARAGMGGEAVEHLLTRQPDGIVIAGFGEGNMPQAVRAALAETAHRGLPVVRASRVDAGLVDREPEDDANGFIAARALGPAKARILLQVLLANGIADAEAIQAAFDRR